MGDYIYAISANGITATNLTTMENSASIPLEYQNPYESYYWIMEEGNSDREEESSSEASDGEDKPEKDEVSSPDTD